MGWELRSKTDCGECRDFYGKKQKSPPCDSHCNFPGLFLENLPAREVLNRLGGALFDGFGGVNLANAESVVRALGYPWDLEMMEKIVAAAMTIRECSKK